MDLGLTNKVAIVTGASTGIGRATALMLVAEGAVVVGASRRPPGSQLDGITHVETDLSEADAPRLLVEKVVADHGRLDILVNNAAIAQTSSGFTEDPLGGWSATIELNLLAAIRGMQAALPHLVETQGVIINITSVNSKLPSPQASAYSATKAALLNVTKGIASEYAGQHVRAVAVAPGFTATPMWLGQGGIAEQVAASMGTNPDVVAETVVASTPLQRFLEPKEVASCICFLASEAASGITGIELVVDGGLTPTI